MQGARGLAVLSSGAGVGALVSLRLAVKAVNPCCSSVMFLGSLAVAA